MADLHDLRWRRDDVPRLSADELDAELGHVVARGRRQKARRRTALAGSLAAASVLVVAVAAVAVRGPDERDDIRAADAPVITTTTSAPANVTPELPSTTVPEVPRPSRAVVVRERRTPDIEMEMALIDGRTGKDIRTLYRSSFGLHYPMLSPDGKYVYFVEESCGGSPVVRLPLDGPAGQQPETVTEGTAHQLAISPDGRLLAYVAAAGCDHSQGDTTLSVRVRNLVTGAEHVLAERQVDASYLGELSWSADGTRLAVAVQHFEAGAYRDGHIVLLDAVGLQDIEKAPRVASPRRGFAFASPTFLPDGNLFVIERPLARPGKDAAMMLVVDLTGRTVRTVATGDPTRFYVTTDADASGKHLLYISRPPENEPGELRVSSNGARTVVLVSGVWEADW